MFEKVMVVEDDADFRLLLVDNLLKYHYEIIQAEDGEQAIAKFQHHKPKLVVMDLLMPKMDGFTVLEKMHELASAFSTPIIIYTNFDKADYLQRAQSYNIQSYYVKSRVEIESVCKRVKELLGYEKDQ